jgi:hypothetical protein
LLTLGFRMLSVFAAIGSSPSLVDPHQRSTSFDL